MWALVFIVAYSMNKNVSVLIIACVAQVRSCLILGCDSLSIPQKKSTRQRIASCGMRQEARDSRAARRQSKWRAPVSVGRSRAQP